MTKPTYLSEYEGRGTMPNTVFPKGSDALTPADKLRLQSLTGQEEDSRAPVNPYHWFGGIGPDTKAEEADRIAKATAAQALDMDERNRYRESPKS